MSPPSLPMKGILFAKFSNMPMPIKMIPKIINVLAIACIVLSLISRQLMECPAYLNRIKAGSRPILHDWRENDISCRRSRLRIDPHTQLPRRDATMYLGGGSNSAIRLTFPPQ